MVVCVDIELSEDLIDAAQTVLRPHRAGDRIFGDVAAVLVTDAGHRFAGVSIDTGSGTGFCAEHNAIAAMVTEGEYRIAVIVAVWRDEQARLYVLPPCGRCREFMRQVDSANLDATVLLGRRRSALLRDLLPEHDWPEPEAEGSARDAARSPEKTQAACPGRARPLILGEPEAAEPSAIVRWWRPVSE
jgi:cytidine deaminase